MDNVAKKFKKSEINRRASFTTRGKRASSMGPGKLGFPHSVCEEKNFYHHISPELPPPIRMKQLMAWSVHRNMDKQDSKHKAALSLAKEVESCFLKDILDGEINFSWYSRPKMSGDKVNPKHLIPHPTNIENEAKRRELVAENKKLEQENILWKKEIERYNLIANSEQFTLNKPDSLDTQNFSDPFELLDDETKAELEELDNLVKPFDVKRVTDILQQLPAKVDEMRHQVYKLHKKTDSIQEKCCTLQVQHGQLYDLEVTRNLEVDTIEFLNALAQDL